MFAVFCLVSAESLRYRSEEVFCRWGGFHGAEYFHCRCAFCFHPAAPHLWGGYSGPWIALCFGHRCHLLFLVFPVAYSFHGSKVSGLYVDFGASKLSVDPVN